jgi:hypothetical protein
LNPSILLGLLFNLIWVIVIYSFYQCTPISFNYIGKIPCLTMAKKGLAPIYLLDRPSWVHLAHHLRQQRSHTFDYAPHALNLHKLY